MKQISKITKQAGRKSATIVGALSFLLVGGAHAQTFTIETLQADGSNLKTNSIVSDSANFAWSFDNNGGTQTVNGITFQEGKSAAISNASVNFRIDQAGANGPYTGSFATVMNEFADSDTPSSGSIDLEIDSLSVGQDYRLQMLHDTKFDTPNNNKRQMRVDYLGTNSFGGTAIASSATFETDGPDLGALSIFEWTAGANTERWEIVAENGRANFQGAVLQAVPEPSAVALLMGLGSLTFVALRRRRNG